MGICPQCGANCTGKTIYCEKVSGLQGDRYPMCKDQPAQIDCRAIKCKKHGKGVCHDISPALTLNPDKSYVCWSMEVESIPSNLRRMIMIMSMRLIVAAILIYFIYFEAGLATACAFLWMTIKDESFAHWMRHAQRHIKELKPY